MDTFVARLAMQARKPFVGPLKVKDKRRRFIHETEDFVVFTPPPYKGEGYDAIALAGS
jgi:hypothetical protein